MTTRETLNQVLAACEANQQRDRDDLFRLLRQPSISAQNTGVTECAALVQDLLTSAGLATQLLTTAGHPMIYAEHCQAPGKPTLLIYGHYDVQPPEPLDAWQSPPFEPTIRDGRIYARGAGDNKGQFFAQIAGLRAWLETTNALPINVKLLIEGEEEIGSPHLDRTVAAHRDLLKADLVYTSDGPVLTTDHPQVVFGVRGILSLELVARGARHDLHSGNWGGIAPNPAWRLVHLLSTMFDADNQITVPDLLDDVAPVSPAMRAAIDRIPLDQEGALRRIGLSHLPPPADLPYFDRLMAHPTMNIAGFTSGYGGAGSKTVLPSLATVKMDIRLVPNQRADDVYDKLVAHIARHAPEVELRRTGSMEPSSTPLDHPAAAPVRRAVERGFGRTPLDIPLLGGSLPDAVWTKTLCLPSFLVPYANPDQNNHAPNENLEIDRFYAGIRTAASLLAELSAAAEIGTTPESDAEPSL